ncbi:MAG: YdcH family protein [Neisseria sp.]|uniref:YdcH family protein n=1 Tax=Neisseria sp. TaxID=192066 RepID=UPI0026DDB379|nr:YdcH family protein [Neisseria sp.]MDO4642023.1 YdcH family protein [Neisseria sp.]
MFPEYRDLISKLKQEDAHFARLFDEHNELDDKIASLENNEVTAVSAAEEIENLKMKKLALKDELYQLLKNAEAKKAQVKI